MFPCNIGEGVFSRIEDRASRIECLLKAFAILDLPSSILVFILHLYAEKDM